MILQDIYYYLKQDSLLSSLLGATGSDTKIYPNIAKMLTRPPFIIYRSTNSGGSKDEVLCEEGLNLMITAASFDDITRITQRLHRLLDLESSVPSQKYFICYCKHVGGTDSLDELGRNMRVLNFNFKFRIK